MSQPTDQQLREWAKLMDDTRWGRLVESLIDYRRREVPNIRSAVLEQAPALMLPDGFPAGKGDGPRGNTELTPTEAAAHALGRAQDVYHESVEIAVDMLAQAVASRNAVKNRLRLIDNLVPDKPATRNVCDVCQRAGYTDPDVYGPDHFGTVGGILTTNQDLCRMDYDFVLARKRLPTVEERRHKEERGRWPAERINPKEKIA